MPAEPDASDPLLAALPQLLRDLAAAAVVELEVTVGQTHLYVRQRPGQAPAGVVGSFQVASSATGRGETAAEIESGLVAVASPLAGVYYATPSPDQAPYASEGDEVEVGQVVALVEAMKVFNEIRTETAGTVTHILAHPGQTVRAGQPLMRLRPRAAAGEGA